MWPLSLMLPTSRRPIRQDHKAPLFDPFKFMLTTLFKDRNILEIALINLFSIMKTYRFRSLIHNYSGAGRL